MFCRAIVTSGNVPAPNFEPEVPETIAGIRMAIVRFWFRHCCVLNETVKSKSCGTSSMDCKVK